jgi:hypothetical protein
VTSTPVGEVCIGDCNGDGEVTVDEILIMVNISLEILPISACLAGDRDGDGMITIDEILTAVYAALNFCAADLVATSARALACPGGCAPQLIEVCARNEGPQGAPMFGVAINGVTVGAFAGLSPAQRACVDVPYVFGPLPEEEAVATLDPDNLVPEIREGDNQVRFPAPNPTACDIICDAE